MKQIILYKKKKTVIFAFAKRVKQRAVTAVAAAATAGLFFTVCGSPTEVVAAESDSVVSQYIYHKHVGNTTSGGACYADTVYHTHAGSEAAGGSCYQTPVYHTHTGSTSAGGGCYGKVIYHSHSGSEQTGGACYEAVLHSHTNGCMTERECTITYEGIEISDIYTEYCYHHQETNHGRATAKQIHSSCGKGTVETEISYCIACGPYPRSHTYEVATCGMTEATVTGYRLSCTKTTATPERYELNCGKNSTTIEKYKLSCKKTAGTIDSYRCSCTLSENQPVARLILKNTTSGVGKTVTLSAEVEDLTGGSLNVGSGSYLWYDKDGSVISRGKTAEVDANGTYRVEFVPPANKNLSGLESSITVKNVYVPTPAPTATPTAKPTATPTAKPTAAPTAKPTAAPTAKPTAAPTAKPTAQPTAKPTAAPTAKPTAAPTAKPTAQPTSKPTAAPTSKPSAAPSAEVTASPAVNAAVKPADTSVSEVNKNTDGNDSGENTTQEGENNKTANPSKTPAQTPSPTPSAPRSVTKKIQSVAKTITKEVTEQITEVKESPSPSVSPAPTTEPEDTEKQGLLESDEEKYEVLGEERKEDSQTREQNRLREFMEKPAVKVITITMGSLVGAGLLFLLLVLLFKTVKVYNDDGTGQMIYLGRCIVMQEGEDFCITISRAMAEKACTNRYSVRAGLFLIGKSDEQELLVCKGQKKISVYLNKEMIVII